MIQVYRHTPGTHACRRGGAELLPAPGEKTDDVIWVDLESPTEEEEEQVFRYFPVHSLTREDVVRPRRLPGRPPHLPKVEEFADYLFVVVNPLRPDAAAALLDPDAESARLTGQLSAVLTHSLLVTHHSEPLVAVDELRSHLARHEACAERGPDYLFHLVLDVMVDQYVPLLDALAEGLDRTEEEVFRRPDAGLLARLLALKRHVIALRKTAVHEREVLARLSRGEFALIDERETAYYRNVYDHLLRFAELIEGSREMVSDLMQTLLAAQANKLNEVMKVLTMISVTILPMSLIAGIYGMNFEKNIWPDFKESTYGFPVALGMMVLSGLSALGFFRWMKWV